MVFVLDSSSDIGSDGWNNLKDFVADMINRNFNIAPNKIRVSKTWFDLINQILLEIRFKMKIMY